MAQENIFKRKHYQLDISQLTVRLHLQYNLSLHDLLEIMEKRRLFWTMQPLCAGYQAFSKEDLSFLSCHKTPLDNC